MNEWMNENWRKENNEWKRIVKLNEEKRDLHTNGWDNMP